MDQEISQAAFVSPQVTLCRSDVLFLCCLYLLLQDAPVSLRVGALCLQGPECDS